MGVCLKKIGAAQVSCRFEPTLRMEEQVALTGRYLPILPIGAVHGVAPDWLSGSGLHAMALPADYN
jgi:hypothetical protein